MRDDDFFWEGLKQDQLLFQQCADCGTLRNPPAPMCSHCQSLKWQPLKATGTGNVCAWLQSKHPTRPDEHPRIVALVQLPEGVRLVSNLRDVYLDEIYDGMPVEVFFEEIDGQVLHQFTPARGGQTP